MKKLLIIGQNFPELTTGAGKRMMQLITLFKEMYIDILFVSTAQKTNYSLSVADLSIKESQILVNDTSFDELLISFKPDVCLFDRFFTEEQFSWRVKENLPSCIRILDTEDLHFLRAARENATKEGKEFEKEYLYNSITQREVAAILRSDFSLIISAFEHQLLINSFNIPNKQLLLLGMFLDMEKVEIQSFEKRSNFVFIGNFLHKPNVDSVHYLKQNIWPLIRKEINDAELHIYGAYMNHSLLSLHNKSDGFIMQSYIDNAIQMLNTKRVLLCPLRFGAGIKVKILEAICLSLPFVATTIALEGFSEENLADMKADSLRDFVSKSVDLYKNQMDYNHKQEILINYANEYTDKKSLFNALNVKLIECMESIESYRKDLIFQQILWHQQLNALKYMSKWIEEKNKKNEIN